MLTTENTVFVLVDVQGRLAELMYEKAFLYDNLETLVRGVQALDLPLLWAEQLPDKMGPTIARLQQLLSPAHTPIVKASFSCCGEPRFMEALEAAGRSHVLLAGIETHVCVARTAIDLLRLGYAVEIVEEAVSSRSQHNKRIGLDRARAAGAGITSIESALFEMLGAATHPRFKDILQLVK
jgi:nicotinamidase-related amidase